MKLTPGQYARVQLRVAAAPVVGATWLVSAFSEQLHAEVASLTGTTDEPVLVVRASRSIELNVGDSISAGPIVGLGMSAPSATITSVAAATPEDLHEAPAARRAAAQLLASVLVIAGVWYAADRIKRTEESDHVR